MTPQQANELLAALERIATPDSGDHSPSKVARDAIAAWNRRAPAPTEPAVDRGIDQLDTYWLTADGVADRFVRVSDIQAWLATPASPAVPADPLDANVLNTLLWFYRRMKNSYGRLPFAEAAIAGMRERLSLKADEDPPADFPAKQLPQASQPTSTPAPLTHAAPIPVDMKWDDKVGGYVSESFTLSDVQARTDGAALKLEDLSMYEDMDRDASESIVRLPRKQLVAYYKDTVADMLTWRRRAVEAEAGIVYQLASLKSCTPEAVNLLVEEAKRVMGRDGGAEGGDGEQGVAK